MEPQRPLRLVRAAGGPAETGPAETGPADAGPAPTLPVGAGDHGLWHVTVTFAGAAVDPDLLAEQLTRLAEQRPVLGSARYAPQRVELRYWEEAADLQDAAALALRLFTDHRGSTGLPDWQVVALEVLDHASLRDREAAAAAPLPQGVQPMPAAPTGPPPGAGAARPWPARPTLGV